MNHIKQITLLSSLFSLATLTNAQAIETAINNQSNSQSFIAGINLSNHDNFKEDSSIYLSKEINPHFNITGRLSLDKRPTLELHYQNTMYQLGLSTTIKPHKIPSDAELIQYNKQNNIAFDFALLGTKFKSLDLLNQAEIGDKLYPRYLHLSYTTGALMKVQPFINTTFKDKNNIKALFLSLKNPKFIPAFISTLSQALMFFKDKNEVINSVLNNPSYKNSIDQDKLKAFLNDTLLKDFPTISAQTYVSQEGLVNQFSSQALKYFKTDIAPIKKPQIRSDYVVTLNAHSHAYEIAQGMSIDGGVQFTYGYTPIHTIFGNYEQQQKYPSYLGVLKGANHVLMPALSVNLHTALTPQMSLDNQLNVAYRYAKQHLASHTSDLAINIRDKQSFVQLSNTLRYTKAFQSITLIPHVGVDISYLSHHHNVSNNTQYDYQRKLWNLDVTTGFDGLININKHWHVNFGITAGAKFATKAKLRSDYMNAYSVQNLYKEKGFGFNSYYTHLNLGLQYAW